MFKPSSTLKAVLNQLIAEKFIRPDEPAKIAETLSQSATEVDTPWYIRGLIGLGGWFAALFFIGFLAVAEIITEEVGAIIVGAIFCAVAVGLKWKLRASIFTGQLALAISLAGQILFIGGLGIKIDNLLLTLLVVILFESLLIALYPDKLHRFLSTLIICGAAFWLVIDLEIEEASHLLVILLAGGTVFLWMYQSRWATHPLLAPLYRPVGYALPIALFGFLIFSFTDELEIEWWWLSAAGLLAVLLTLEYLILSQPDFKQHANIMPWVLAGTTLLIIPALETPGILAALIVLLLGYHRGNRLLLGLAVAFLAGFLSGYYYTLNLTLLTKSFVLLGTGLILLGLRYAVGRYTTPVEVN